MNTRIHYPFAIVLAALVGAAANILVAWITNYKATQPPSPPSNVTTLQVPTIADGQTRVSGFGTWVENLKPNVAYHAESDGFVSTYSVGSSPAQGADVFSGSMPNKLTPRSRVNAKWSGAVVPVAKGDYWMVQPLPGGGSLNVEWMPISYK